MASEAACGFTHLIQIMPDICISNTDISLNRYKYLYLLELHISLIEMEISVIDLKYIQTIFNHNINICISVRDIYMSNTEICISIRYISNQAEFWISAFKIQVSVIEMSMSVFEMRYLNF